MPSIGDIWLTMSADTVSFEAGMKKAAEQVTAAVGSMKESLSGVEGMLESLGERMAEFVSAAAIIEFSKEVISTAASLGDMAARTGVTTDQLQVFHAVASEAGQSTEQMDAVLTRFNSTLGKAEIGVTSAENAFRALGIDVKALSAAGVPMQDVLVLTAQRLQSIEDPARRAAAEIQLFGAKMGGSIDALAQGADKIDEVKQRLEAAGAIITPQEVIDARVFRAELDFAITELEAWTAHALEIVARWVDAHKEQLTRFAQANNDALNSLKGPYDTWADAVFAAVSKASDYLKAYDDYIGALATIWPTKVHDLVNLTVGPVNWTNVLTFITESLARLGEWKEKALAILSFSTGAEAIGKAVDLATGGIGAVVADTKNELGPGPGQPGTPDILSGPQVSMEIPPPIEPMIDAGALTLTTDALAAYIAKQRDAIDAAQAWLSKREASDKEMPESIQLSQQEIRQREASIDAMKAQNAELTTRLGLLQQEGPAAVAASAAPPMQKVDTAKREPDTAWKPLEPIDPGAAKRNADLIQQYHQQEAALTDLKSATLGADLAARTHMTTEAGVPSIKRDYTDATIAQVVGIQKEIEALQEANKVAAFDKGTENIKAQTAAVGAGTSVWNEAIHKYENYNEALAIVIEAEKLHTAQLAEERKGGGLSVEVIDQLATARVKAARANQLQNEAAAKPAEQDNLTMKVRDQIAALDSQTAAVAKGASQYSAASGQVESYAHALLVADEMTKLMAAHTTLSDSAMRKFADDLADAKQRFAQTDLIARTEAETAAINRQADATGQGVIRYNAITHELELYNRALELAAAKEQLLASGADLSGQDLERLANDMVNAKDHLTAMGQAAEQTSRQLQAINGFAMGAAGAITNSFADALLQTKSLHDVFQSLIQDLARMAINAALLGPMQAMMGGFMGAAFMGGGGAIAAGGLLGAPMAAGGIVSTPQMHLIGESGPEAVIPLSAMADVGGGGTMLNVTNNVNISTSGSGQQDPAQAKLIGMQVTAQLRQMVHEELQQAQRPGGMLNASIGG